jgi:hypothetical protein
MLCPQNLFLCFVWISQKTAIISLYSFNCLFLQSKQCTYVYYVVQTESLTIIQVHITGLITKRPPLLPATDSILLISRKQKVCTCMLLCMSHINMVKTSMSDIINRINTLSSFYQTVLQFLIYLQPI